MERGQGESLTDRDTKKGGCDWRSGMDISMSLLFNGYIWSFAVVILIRESSLRLEYILF